MRGREFEGNVQADVSSKTVIYFYFVDDSIGRVRRYRRSQEAIYE